MIELGCFIGVFNYDGKAFGFAEKFKQLAEGDFSNHTNGFVRM